MTLPDPALVVTLAIHYASGRTLTSDVQSLARRLGLVLSAQGGLLFARDAAELAEAEARKIAENAEVEP